MKTELSKIPVIQKSKIEKKTAIGASSCCVSKNDTRACCIPSETKEANNGNCCAQPEDGSACCSK